MGKPLGDVRQKACVLTALLLLFGSSLWGRTITDQIGRTVTLSEHPHRIVCLAPSLTNTVYELGHGGDVVGVTDYAKYPAEAKKKPSVGSVIDPSLETIIALKPDLVLMLSTMGNYETLRSLERLKLPVFAVKAVGLEGVYQSILSVGDAIDDAPAARTLVKKLRERQQRVQQRMAGKPRPTLLLVVWGEPLFTAGRGAFITDLIAAAGGQSVTADLPQEWPQISLETVIERQPKYLVLIRGNQLTPEQLQKLPGWLSLPAVRDHRIIWVDDRIYYPSPVMLDAMEDLSQQLVAAESH